jgi:hypothetical protein
MSMELVKDKEQDGETVIESKLGRKATGRSSPYVVGLRLNEDEYKGLKTLADKAGLGVKDMVMQTLRERSDLLRTINDLKLESDLRAKKLRENRLAIPSLYSSKVGDVEISIHSNPKTPPPREGEDNHVNQEDNEDNMVTTREDNHVNQEDNRVVQSGDNQSKLTDDELLDTARELITKNAKKEGEKLTKAEIEKRAKEMVAVHKTRVPAAEPSQEIVNIVKKASGWLGFDTKKCAKLLEDRAIEWDDLAQPCKDYLLRALKQDKPSDSDAKRDLSYLAERINGKAKDLIRAYHTLSQKDKETEDEDDAWTLSRNALFPW